MGSEVDHVHQLLESFSTAMLVTHPREQSPRARPMAIARVETSCGMWFFTGNETGKVHEIQDDDHV